MDSRQTDFSSYAQLDDPLQAGGLQALRPWGGQGPLRVLPQALALAARADGHPDFQFDLIRRDDRSQPPYALLQFRVQAAEAAEASLDALRSAAPQQPLQPLEFSQGFLRLLPVGASLNLPPALTAPQPLAWNDLGRAAFRLRLDGDAARLTEGLLLHTAIPLLAYAELEYCAIVPGLPLAVEFDPARLCAALRQGAQGPLRRVLLLERLRAYESLPLAWAGSPAGYPAALVAEALLAHLRRELARFAPGPEADQHDYLELPPAAPGRMQWDLSAPCLARRGLCLTLRSFDALEKLGNPSAWLHRIALPAPGFGSWRVDLAADLPPGLTVRFGVSLHAPATSQRRAINTEIVELPAPGYQATASLRFAPDEQPAWQAKTWCRWPGGQWECGTQAAPANPQRLTLGSEDFPARYVRLGISRRLAAAAVLHCVASGVARGTPFCFSVTLDAARPQATLCCPLGATQETLQVQAAAPDASQPPVLLTLPLQSAELDLPHFPGYGAYSVLADCRFSDARNAVLLLEMAGESLQNSTVLRLTPAAASARYSGWSASPFPPRYRWRQHGTQQWSAPLPAGQALHLVLANGAASVFQPTEEFLP